MAMPRPDLAPGAPMSSVDSPALLVDLTVFERNSAVMMDFVRSHGIRLRAHGKSHKCGAIARLQQAAGAIGLCCQKVSEAEAFVAAGIRDVLVTNEVIDLPKLRRLARLSGRARIGICIDSVLGLERLAEAAQEAVAPIDVYVEIDVGAARCGVLSTADALSLIDKTGMGVTKLRYAGIQAYQGQAQHLRQPAQRQAAIDVAVRRVIELRDAMAQRGLPIGIVTGAGTGTFYLETGSGVYDEIQPGSYIFMDRDYRDNETAPDTPRFEHSLTLLTTVMSARPDHAVVDAGHKAHAVDSGMPAIFDRADLVYGNPSDEHGVIRRKGDGPLPLLGERLRLIPGHCDPTVNLHDWLIVHRGEEVVDIWPVEARGALT
ncbi:DSD1 family PLP-dependent enzyme [Dongia soli]|uniref:DSD1 family PLP-dependent enzyme n=1 Tax=Dongia soli TaxID=600628 RepID=A0ABU5EGJ5_9PROT|nr:DSD1 family PLP-dependent enzyme [Dongia soli]MDY0885341.1 DSD1 family PLP-dependent enzyme [Dongia soli]